MRVGGEFLVSSSWLRVPSPSLRRRAAPRAALRAHSPAPWTSRTSPSSRSGAQLTLLKIPPKRCAAEFRACARHRAKAQQRQSTRRAPSRNGSHRRAPRALCTAPFPGSAEPSARSSRRSQRRRRNQTFADALPRVRAGSGERGSRRARASGVLPHIASPAGRREGAREREARTSFRVCRDRGDRRRACCARSRAGAPV